MWKAVANPFYNINRIFPTKQKYVSALLDELGRIQISGGSSSLAARSWPDAICGAILTCTLSVSQSRSGYPRSSVKGKRLINFPISLCRRRFAGLFCRMGWSSMSDDRTLYDIAETNYDSAVHMTVQCICIDIRQMTRSC